MFLDTWSWVEFFRGTEKGAIVRDMIDGKKLCTSILTLAEIANWCARNGLDRIGYIKEITETATIINLDEHRATEAGSRLVEWRKIANEMGLIDALIYTQAVCAGMPLLTGDPHFKKLANVEFVE